MDQGFVCGRMCPREKQQPLRFVPAQTKSFHNVGGHGFRGAPDLTSLFMHLKSWQPKCHTVNMHSQRLTPFENLQISVPPIHLLHPSQFSNPTSIERLRIDYVPDRIPHLTSHIPNLSSLISHLISHLTSHIPHPTSHISDPILEAND